MKTIKSLIFTGLLACVGCISVDVSIPSLCDSQAVSFPEPADLSTACALATASGIGGSASYSLPPLTTTTTFDYSNDLNKIEKVAANLAVQVNQLSLDNTNNDFSFVHFIEVDIQGANQVAFPTVVLATYTAPTAGVGSELDFVVNPDTNLLLNYLKSGQVLLTLTLNSNPVMVAQVCSLFKQGNLPSTVHMCVSASGSFSKKL